MRLEFRQGIIRYQVDQTATPIFLAKSVLDSSYIDIKVNPDPTIITFADADSDYTVEETRTVPDAWGPFQANGQTQYLYWDIDVVSGLLSRSFTIFPPIVQPSTPPLTRPDQHWFDTSDMVMKVYDVRLSRWVRKIRVFAAVYSSSALIEPYTLGSQVGIDNLEYKRKTGFVIFDSEGDPIRDRHGKFVTTEHTLGTQDLKANSANSFQLEGEIKTVVATEFIPKFYLVTLVGESRVSLASSLSIDTRVHGIMGEDFYENETGRLITSGIINNEQWNWSTNDIGKPLFCSIDGEVILAPPQVGIVQIIGYVYSKRSINLNIQLPFII